MKLYKTTLVYLALAVIVGGIAYLSNHWPPKKEEKKEKVFDQFVADDISEIQIENLGTTLPAQKTPILLKKDATDSWQIASPQNYRADESIVRAMLSGVGDMTPDVTIDKPANLKDYGLDPPLARCTLRPKVGTPFVLLIGDKDMTSSGAYVKTADKDKVYLVTSYAADNLHKNLNDYRDHNFIKTDMVVAKKVQITRDGKTTVFEKDKDNVWNITEPLKAKTDTSKIRDLLNTISSLRIEDFVSDHPAGLSSYGLSSPRLTVEVWPSDGGAPKSILVGHKKDKTANFYAKDGDGPSIYLVGQYFDKGMDLKLSDYRDKTFLQFDGSTVKALTVKRGSQIFPYGKDDKGQWLLPGRPNAPTEAMILVNQLSGLTVSDFAAKGTATGLASPAYVTEVTLGSGATRVFKFGKREKGQVYVSVDKDPQAYLVSDAVVSQMDGYFNTILTPVVVASPAATPK